MFKLSKNNLITITRGDSALFSLSLNIGSTVDPDYIDLENIDKIYFGVTEPNKPFEFGLIKKVLTSEDCSDTSVTIKLKPEDTMLVMPGIYYYSLKILTIDGDVYTTIDKRKFTIID